MPIFRWVARIPFALMVSLSNHEGEGTVHAAHGSTSSP